MFNLLEFSYIMSKKFNISKYNKFDCIGKI